MSQTSTSRTHLHYHDSCLRSLNFLSSHCNALLAVAPSIVAAIAKRWIGKVEEILEEAIKWNVQILKYAAKNFFFSNLFWLSYTLNFSGLHEGIW